MPDPRWNWEPAIRAEDNGSTKVIFSDTLGDREVELGFHKPPKLQAYAPPIRVTQELPAKRITEPQPGVHIYDLAGIDTDGPGYRRIVIRPGPPTPDSNPDHKTIGWVRVEYDSVRGRIASAWRRDASSFELDVTIPANTTATVHVPAPSADAVKEGGKPLAATPAVKFLRLEGGRAVLSVEAGAFRFVAKSVR
jgi:hypothetical protein